MQTYSTFINLTGHEQKTVVALGMFDGVHVGHQSIIRRAIELAQSIGGTSVVFTFSNHPLSVLSPQDAPLSIGSPHLRAAILAAMGVDVLVSIPFTKEFSRIPAEKFLALLRQNFAPTYIVTGDNYTFGRMGKGNRRMLMREAKNYGFQTEICPTVLRGKLPVSSTRIRKLLREGDLATANAFLGYPFTFMEHVVHGDQRGRAIGFPTANLPIGNDRAMLPNGAYAVQAIFGHEAYDGMANIGDNPTFAGCDRRLEVHLQDFTGDLYGKLLQVRFLEKLREEKKFPSVDHLVRQLQRDREAAKTIWARYR